MIGIRFGSIHTYDDWKLLLAQKQIGLPEVKTTTVEVPGVDGILDLTEALTGSVCYGNRELSFTFIALDALSGMTWAELLTKISAAIHGKKMDIVLDDDPEWKYTGRVTIDSFETSRSKRTVVIKCDCDPYKTSLTDGSKSL